MGGAVGIISLLKSYLQTLQADGEMRLPVDDDARRILREWMLAAKRGGVRPPRPGAELDQLAQMRAVLADDEPDTPEDDEEMEAFFRPAGRTPEELWERARKLILNWPPLKNLHTLRDTLVWSEGSRTADIMFVGDAPNYYDEQNCRPFCGDAGAKLDGMLKAMGLSRSEVYITHLVKFRPMVPRQTFNNRPPSREEIRMSVPVLEFETKLVQPKVIVALGVIAARALLQQSDLPLSACQQIKDGRFFGIPVVVTHHPSYLLRTTSVAERRRLWEEMLRVMEIAGLPITPKQRGYFLTKGS